MIRRLPLLPTVLVLVAVGVMIALGLWQLDRRDEKAAMLARYEAAQAMSSDVPFPRGAAAAETVLYRHSSFDCRRVLDASLVAGRNAEGEPGLAHVAKCAIADGGEAVVVLGWSREPELREWSGGQVSGIIAPGPRLVAHPPVAGLEANAVPDPSDIPDNHLAYAVQWFFFAATALAIYALAVRKRLAGDAPRR